MKKEHKARRRRITQLSRRKQQHPAEWVPVQAPPHFGEMYQRWIECGEPNIGWCLLCDEPACSPDDLIPGTNTHTCAAGRELEEKIRLAEAAASNRKLSSIRRAATMRNSSGEPRVGIFFVYDGKPFIQSTPVSEGEAYGNFSVHATGHPAFWQALQRKGLVPITVEYDEVPRGRVGYDTKERKFHIMVDPCIKKDQRMIDGIERDMRLPSANTAPPRLDSHYGCPGCMRPKKTKKQLEQEEQDWDF
jgi:hypothetical protein